MTRIRNGSSSRLVLVWLLPALLFLGLYLRALDYDFVWTDQGEIEMGLLILPPERIGEAYLLPMLHDLETHAPTAKAPYYRPVQVIAASWIDHRFGRTPRNFRILNLLLGASTCALVALLAWQLLRRTDLALIAGGIFAAHPANIENTVWIAGLSQSLASFFMVANLLFALIVLEGRGAWRRACAGLGAIGCGILALGSKESAAVAPILLFALLIERHRRERQLFNGGQSAPGTGKLAAGWFLLAVQLVIAMLFIIVWRPRILGTLLSDSAPLGGSQQLQIATAISNWPKVMSWLVFPLQSSTSDVVMFPASVFDPRVLAGAALAAISLAFWVRLSRRGHATAALGLAWIWIAFAPTSGLLPLNHLHGERYVSLSLIGFALLVPALLSMLQVRVPEILRSGVAAGLGFLLVTGYAQRSFQRIPDWRSDLLLFGSDSQRDPLYREGHFELAKAHIIAGDLESAKASIETLRGLGDAFQGHTSFLRREDVIDLYCRINLHRGSAGDSISYFDTLHRDSPEIQALPNTALCGARSLAAVGRREQAEEVLEAILKLTIAPFSAEAGAELALMAADRDDRNAARRWLERFDSQQIRDRDLAHRIEVLRRRLGAPIQFR